MTHRPMVPVNRFVKIVDIAQPIWISLEAHAATDACTQAAQNVACDTASSKCSQRRNALGHRFLPFISQIHLPGACLGYGQASRLENRWSSFQLGDPDWCRAFQLDQSVFDRSALGIDDRSDESVKKRVRLTDMAQCGSFQGSARDRRSVHTLRYFHP